MLSVILPLEQILVAGSLIAAGVAIVVYTVQQRRIRNLRREVDAIHPDGPYWSAKRGPPRKPKNQ